MSDIKETIRQLERLKAHCAAMQEIDNCANYSEYIKTVDTAINALKSKSEEYI